MLLTAAFGVILQSWSLKMATLDRSRMTSYQSTIVSISLPCTILEICDIEEYSDLEIQDR